MSVFLVRCVRTTPERSLRSGSSIVGAARSAPFPCLVDTIIGKDSRNADGADQPGMDGTQPTVKAGLALAADRSVVLEQAGHELYRIEEAIEVRSFR
jgi:hypothetical protein